jgi:class 3 adenylate cyclase
MSETRKLAAILVADIVGYSRLAGADEDRILARLRTLRSDLIDPILAVHHGRVVKRSGDGWIIEFRSVVDAVRCAIEVQSAMVERNAGVPPERRIEFRVGVHLGDVVEEEDSDLMGDGVNVAARLEGIAKPGAICLSEQAYWQVKGRLDLKVTDLGAIQLKNIAEPVRVYALEVGAPAQPKPTPSASSAERPAPPRLSIVVLPFANLGGDPEQDYFVDGVTESLTTDLSRISNAFVIARNTAFTYKGKAADVRQIGCDLNVRYVLEGSVQRGGNRMRVNVQLIDAETGSHLWANASTSRSPTSSTCKTRSCRASPTGSDRNSPPPKRAAPSAWRTRTRWITISSGSATTTRPEPSSSTRRVLTSTAPSNLIRRMSTRWSGARGSI